MIEIVFERDEQGRTWALRCVGHAGFSASEEGGVDIVCAAVSALTGYLGLTFAQVLDLPSSVQAADGQFAWARSQGWADEVNRVADRMLEGWLLAARGLEENYSGWVRVTETPWRRESC